MLVIFAGFCPTAAASELDPFPDVTFRVFSDFITKNFSSKISLGTILTVLFTLTSNPDLLNLYARQQHPQNEDERHHAATGWMNALSQALQEHLKDDSKRLLPHKEWQLYKTNDQTINAIGIKLDALCTLLGMNPFYNGKFQQKLKPIDDSGIQPIYIICPNAMECETETCSGHSLSQNT